MNDKTTPRPWEGTCVSFFGKRGSLDDDALAQEAVNSYEANQQTIRELSEALESVALALDMARDNHPLAASQVRHSLKLRTEVLAKLTPEVKP